MLTLTFYRPAHFDWQSFSTMPTGMPNANGPGGFTSSSKNEKPINLQHHSASPFPRKKSSIGHHDPDFTGANVDFSHVNEKKVLRKMDIRLLPMLALLYLLAFLDRGNIGNAKIEGLTESLKMTGPQYNWTCKLTLHSRPNALSNAYRPLPSDCILLHLLRL